jgi:hypothetical protein
MVAQKIVVHEILLHEHGQQRTQTERIPARAHAEMMIGQLGGLGRPRIDDDERPVWIFRDLPEYRACAWKPVGVPRVLADEESHLGLGEIAGRVTARTTEELTVDPELAGFLLRQRVRRVDGTEGGARGAGVRSPEMIPLPAATVVEDLVAAVRIAHADQALGNLRNGGVPVDGLETAIGPPPQWRRQTIAAVLVVVEPRWFLAQIAPRPGMRLVATDAPKPASVQLDLEATVDAAQDTGRLLKLAAHVRPSLVEAGHVVRSADRVHLHLLSYVFGTHSVKGATGEHDGGPDRRWFQ